MAPLTSAQRQRYARQIRLDGFGAAGQEALTDAHVLVIGAGGLGAPVLTYLAAAGVGRLSIVDPDVVELSNLHRQFIHSETGVGRRKVDSARDRLAELNSSIEIVTHPVLLTVDNALDLVGGADVVVDGSDNFATRYLANDACEILGVPLVWGTILGFDGQVAVFDARRGATLRDLYPVVPAPGSVPDCATAGVIGALCGSIGAAMAMETIKLLAGIGTPLHDAVSIYDSLTATWETVPVGRNPRRPAVADLHSHLGDYGEGAGEQGTAACPTSTDETPTVTWAQFPGGVDLIDIREPAEVSAGMVPGAEHLPMDELLEHPEAIAGRSVALYCRSGVRSARACAALRARGFDVSSVSGGYLAYLSRL
ncbi:adenylyltransferase/sulfurtransferase [Brevibacterium sanguinis]|uniref:Adenylyltransferase/sulfurtransferase n=2 Tax=Brevibacterium TaxID=1696 RepID=A0A366II31_9MICO|nr:MULTISPECIES: ThiF family adenylyltransferase [Brevibacterium]RBP64195.1 adenylyltransferase/sulfurtransferase [Brevibacterium sanguinis]RBP71513.1 adenylyltransferase/sulfurtransferase [Brevibacterium celere]